MRWAIVVVLLGALAAAQQAAEEREGNRGGRRAGITVPAGTQIPLKLAQGISTKSAKVGDAVYAQTVFPITANDRIVIPAGTYVQGRISEIKRPGRVKGRAEFLMHFTTMIFHSGYTVMLPGAVENVPGSEKQTVKGQGRHHPAGRHQGQGRGHGRQDGRRRRGGGRHRGSRHPGAGIGGERRCCRGPGQRPADARARRASARGNQRADRAGTAAVAGGKQDPINSGQWRQWLELVSKIHFRLRKNVPQGLKPTILAASSGTAEAVPFPKTDS